MKKKFLLLHTFGGSDNKGGLSVLGPAVIGEFDTVSKCMEEAEKCLKAEAKNMAYNFKRDNETVKEFVREYLADALLTYHEDTRFELYKEVEVVRNDYRRDYWRDYITYTIIRIE